MTDESPQARFAGELRRLRVQAGLSVRQLAAELHRAHSSIVGYESGRRLAGVEVVEQYEDYFGLVRGTLGCQRERVRAQRLESPRDATVDEHLGASACPYKGLHAFEYEDAALFFGRETQVERVVARLAQVRFVAVVGASGSGKSSFVRAGLLAGIDATWANAGAGPGVALLTPGEHPVEELASAIGAAIGDAERVLPEDLRADPDRLRRAIRQPGPGGVVIAVDQFEELFTLCREETERRCFVDALLAAWRDPASPVTVIVALRADFYGRVAAYPDLAAAVVAHQTLIGPMSQADLRRAIELPAAQRGLLLQPGLVETILEDLAGEPGALPLLSHALLETWKRRRRLMLTVGGYREAGGVRRAIAQTAERTLHSLPEADQETARVIFLKLTDVGESSEPTRRRVDRAELAADARADQSLERVFGILADARLLTIDERTVMVAHEALIRHWPRLRGWIDADRAGLVIHRRLNDAAREWDTLKRDPSAVYRGARLATASEWATDHDDDLNQLERDFLTASQATVARRTRRLRLLATGSAVLTAIVAALAMWALAQRRDAQRQATQATSLALASSSAPLVESRPDVALLLALAAYRTSQRVETQSSVLSALTAARDPGVLAIMHGHAGEVVGVAFSPDGHTLASASSDGTARLWDARTHRPLGPPLTGHTGVVIAVTFSPDGHTLATSSYDKTVRLWDTRSHKPLGAPLTGHSSSVWGVAFARDGRTLASASNDNTIRLWDARTRKSLGVLADHSSTIYGVAFSPDGRTLASASADKTIRLWNARTRRPLGVLAGHSSGVYGVAFSPDGRMLASSSNDNTVRLWDVRAQRPRGTPLAGHTDLVASVAFSPDGRTLASASNDKTVRMWDVRTRRPLVPALTGHTSIIYGVAFSPDGQMLASSSADQTIRLWNARTQSTLGQPPIRHTSSIAGVAFSPDGRRIASAHVDGTVRFSSVTAHRALGPPLNSHTGPVTSVAFSPDGRTLASSSWDRTIRLWDARTRKPLGTLKGHSDTVMDVAFSPDGRTLASTSGDKTVRLWDARTRKPLGTLKGHSNTVMDVAFSPEGRTLASVSDADKTIRLWDVRTHKQLGGPLTGHTSPVEDVAFSPDGRTLASASADKTVRLWDARTHKPLGKALTGHSSTIYGVAFSPDGRTLASASADKTVRLWDIRTRKPLGPPLTGHTDAVIGLAFSPDGRTLASAGGYDKTIRFWQTTSWRNLAELQKQVCALVGSGLSKTEWAQHVPGIPYRQSCP